MAIYELVHTHTLVIFKGLETCLEAANPEIEITVYWRFWTSVSIFAGLRCSNTLLCTGWWSCAGASLSIDHIQACLLEWRMQCYCAITGAKLGGRNEFTELLLSGNTLIQCFYSPCDQKPRLQTPGSLSEQLIFRFIETQLYMLQTQPCHKNIPLVANSFKVKFFNAKVWDTMQYIIASWRSTNSRLSIHKF